jgi:sec-independent protein translocase protein TatB
MFGMGGSEIIVILIVALLFLGPDKLPGAAKTISKGIRDLKKQSRSLQQQIESDEQIGGAIRDLKSALRGDEEPRSIPPPRSAYNPPPVNTIHAPDPDAADKPAEPGAGVTPEAPAQAALPAPADKPFGWMPGSPGAAPELAATGGLATGKGNITLPATAGEADGPAPAASEDAELAAMIKPASGTVAKGS